MAYTAESPAGPDSSESKGIPTTASLEAVLLSSSLDRPLLILLRCQHGIGLPAIVQGLLLLLLLLQSGTDLLVELELHVL